MGGETGALGDWQRGSSGRWCGQEGRQRKRLVGAGAEEGLAWRLAGGKAWGTERGGLRGLGREALWPGRLAQGVVAERLGRQDLSWRSSWMARLAQKPVAGLPAVIRC